MIAAVGRLKSGPERDLAERYLKRTVQAGRSLGLNQLEVIEIRESRADNPARRMLEESIAITNMIPERAVIVLMDERGENLPSAAFAGLLQAWRAENKHALVFAIGGADGLAPGLKVKSSLTMGFGAATWPHQLVRVMLLEQLYRAVTILSGHPYHRA